VKDETSFGLALTLLDLCVFLCYGIARFHGWRRVKTSFGLGLTLLVFSHFLLFGCLG
jgi:hypothetical protein